MTLRNNGPSHGISRANQESVKILGYLLAIIKNNRGSIEREASHVNSPEAPGEEKETKKEYKTGDERIEREREEKKRQQKKKKTTTTTKKRSRRTCSQERV